MIFFAVYFLGLGLFLRTGSYDRFYNWMMGPGGVPARFGTACAPGPNRTSLSWLAIIAGSVMAVAGIVSLVAD